MIEEIHRLVKASGHYDYVYKSNYEILPWERGKLWLVTQPITVLTRYNKYVTVPEGFWHDRFTVVPDLPNAIVAAIVHDWLYDALNSNHLFDDGTEATRKQADIIFRDLIWQSKDWIFAYPYYYGVRVFGRKYWND